MISVIDPSELEMARRIVEIQRAAYAVEAALIGFDGIPQLNETVEQVSELTQLDWRGVLDDGQLAGLIAWEADDDLLDIDRLAVDPAFARRGHGRRLVQAVPADRMIIVSTGTANDPARQLYLSEGFSAIGRTEIAPGISTTQFRRSARRVGACN